MINLQLDHIYIAEISATYGNIGYFTDNTVNDRLFDSWLVRFSLLYLGDKW